MKSKIYIATLLLSGIFGTKAMSIHELEEPIIFKPTNKEVITTHNAITQIENLDLDKMEIYLLALISSKNDDANNINIINKIMTYFLFEPDHSAYENDQATPNIQDLYQFCPQLLNALCKSSPEDLVCRSAWQILNTMPCLYDLFWSMDFIETRSSYFFDANEFEESLEKSDEKKYLDQYLELMFRTACSGDARKEIVLEKLTQKLGANIEFLNYAASKITELPFVKNIIEALEIESKKTSNAIYTFESSMEDMQECMNLVLQAIEKLQS